jgi:hypothetical protein
MEDFAGRGGCRRDLQRRVVAVNLKADGRKSAATCFTHGFAIHKIKAKRRNSAQ